jgi:uncharacterized damage-inducible protein DinB
MFLCFQLRLQAAAMVLAAHHAVRVKTYPLADLIHHLLNRSTYHRGQVALLLRQLGRTPPATDYWLFLTGRASRAV